VELAQKRLGRHSAFPREPEYYSISVHGCAHTRAEFGSADSEHLYAKTRQALERMDQHAAATGLAHDRVMVFRKAFFRAAMRILNEQISSLPLTTIPSAPIEIPLDYGC